MSILSIAGYIITSGIQILFNVFQTVNKVKPNAIAMIITGIVSSIITILLVNYTDYGIYAVAGVSTICAVVKNMIFTLPATAKYLGFKWNVFYKEVLTSIISSILLIFVGFFIKSFVNINSWFSLILIAGFIGITGLVINIGIVLNKEDRKFLFGKVKNKITKYI